MKLDAKPVELDFMEPTFRGRRGVFVDWHTGDDEHGRGLTQDYGLAAVTLSPVLSMRAVADGDRRAVGPLGQAQLKGF